MASGASIVEVPPLLLAAVRRRATAATLANTIISAPIWSLSADRGLRTTNETVVVYYDDGTGLLQNSPDGVAIDVGVLLDEPFAGDLLLQCAMTPAGRAARARHLGSYEFLRDIHDSIRDWCAANGHALWSAPLEVDRLGLRN